MLPAHEQGPSACLRTNLGVWKVSAKGRRLLRARFELAALVRTEQVRMTPGNEWVGSVMWKRPSVKSALPISGWGGGQRVGGPHGRQLLAAGRNKGCLQFHGDLADTASAGLLRALPRGGGVNLPPSCVPF